MDYNCNFLIKFLESESAKRAAEAAPQPPGAGAKAGAAAAAAASSTAVPEAEEAEEEAEAEAAPPAAAAEAKAEAEELAKSAVEGTQESLIEIKDRVINNIDTFDPETADKNSLSYETKHFYQIDKNKAEREGTSDLLTTHLQKLDSQHKIIIDDNIFTVIEKTFIGTRKAVLILSINIYNYDTNLFYCYALSELNIGVSF